MKSKIKKKKRSRNFGSSKGRQENQNRQNSHILQYIRPEQIPKAGEFTGTFRWAENKKLHSLPSFPDVPVNIDQGWAQYFKSRSPGRLNLEALAKADPSFVDGLSFPLTVLHTVHKLKEKYSLVGLGNALHVVVMGATSKAEERILKESCYWCELAYFYSDRQVHLTLCGPEISQTVPELERKPSWPDNFHACLFKGTSLNYFVALKDRAFGRRMLTIANTVYFAFNGGFGNFVESKRMQLLWSWINDLYCLSALKVPVFFTCANDYADMQGEFLVMSKILGARFLSLPKQNPFLMATHLADPDDSAKWARGNIYWYAIQGYDDQRRHEINITREDRQKQMADAISSPDVPMELMMAPQPIPQPPTTSVLDQDSSSYGWQAKNNGKAKMSKNSGEANGANASSGKSTSHSSNSHEFNLNNLSSDNHVRNCEELPTSESQAALHQNQNQNSALEKKSNKLISADPAAIGKAEIDTKIEGAKNDKGKTISDSQHCSSLHMAPKIPNHTLEVSHTRPQYENGVACSTMCVMTLVVKTPEMKSSNSTSLIINEKFIWLEVEHTYLLKKSLPFKANHEKASAHFNKTKRHIKISIPFFCE
mmetsp:Transcript_8800/g.11618  ORF Transcript_8800/g.11618 Transcript_8800/m.11618 type:complete len:595 (+) Transcript_8800:61-1845(+)